MIYRLVLKEAQPQQCGTCRHWGQPIDETRRNAWCFHREIDVLTPFHAGGMCPHYQTDKGTD